MDLDCDSGDCGRRLSTPAGAPAPLASWPHPQGTRVCWLLTFNAFLLWHGMFSGLAAFKACVCDIVLTLFEFIIEDFISFTRGQVWDLHDTERFPVAGNYCAPSPLPPFLRGSEWAEVPAFVLCLCAQGC